jgi:glutamate-1-semialdehyde aminotransferase
MNGFRIVKGCVQEYCCMNRIMPDLTTVLTPPDLALGSRVYDESYDSLCWTAQMGKVIGGGLPVGAYGGRRDIMQMVAPAGVEHPRS